MTDTNTGEIIYAGRTERERQSEALGLEHWCADHDEDTPSGDHTDECCYLPECPWVEVEPECEAGLQHQWTTRGVAGNSEGAMLLGGTTTQFLARCRACGMERREVHNGWQRNPGECDSVTYEPEAYEPEADEPEADDD